MTCAYCGNPFIAGFFGMIGFFAWINMFRIYHFALPRIKKEIPDLYEKIVPHGRGTWLERGWSSPSDAGVQYRLIISVYQGKANKVLPAGIKTWKVYKWSVWVFIISSIIFLLGSSAFGICLVRCAMINS